MKFKTKKYKVIFVIKRYDMYVVKHILNLSEINKVFAFKKRQFTVNVNNPTYVSGGLSTYIIDYDNSSQLNFVEIKAPLGVHDLDLLFGQKIIKELTKGVLMDRKEKLWNIIIGAIVGFMLAFLIATLVYQSKIDDLYSQLLDDSFTPIIPL